MSCALEIRGLYKSFTAGIGTCRISALVLRGVDLTVHGGECVGIVGPNGSGKSTLLLCAAGLLRGDRGSVQWFGDASPGAALHNALYYPGVAAASWGTPARPAPCLRPPLVHLVDLTNQSAIGTELGAWIAEQRSRGDAVVIATRDERVAKHCAARVLALRGGIFIDGEPTWDRVAERLPSH